VSLYLVVRAMKEVHNDVKLFTGFINHHTRRWDVLRRIL
jgi:hypothetical protein